MNRKAAKYLTTAGIFACSISLILFVIKAIGKISFPQIVLPVLFIGGIVLITFSLAYYTDK